MGMRVALHHITRYDYDRPVALSPHEVRLRPTSHGRTPVLSYRLSVVPTSHFVHWREDPYGNDVARFVFSERTRHLQFTVELTADLAPINPFDFFIEPYAENFPFDYDPQLREDLSAYLRVDPGSPLLAEWILRLETGAGKGPGATTRFLVSLNQALARDVAYEVRLEPGVQTPEQTLQLARGSCRDSTWLLVQILRRLGLGARFVSGYLIELKGDGRPLAGPSGREADGAGLHAWAEAYLPGAGWIGLDPTSGLLAGEGHIPLACSATPVSAAPIIGTAESARVDFHHEIRVERVRA
jgi:transglutaminase-like putative cysteine protease